MYSGLCVTECRPEADDVKALQQELSSLHIVMEKSTSEFTKQIDELTKAKALYEEEKMRFIFNHYNYPFNVIHSNVDLMNNWKD